MTATTSFATSSLVTSSTPASTGRLRRALAVVAGATTAFAIAATMTCSAASADSPSAAPSRVIDSPMVSTAAISVVGVVITLPTFRSADGGCGWD